MPPKKATEHSIVTYNVLSPNLAGPDHYYTCDGADLDPQTRWERVLAKLEVEVEAGAIIALQEVSQEWAGRLYAYFQQNGYTFICRQYAKDYSGYMGVGIAFPNDKYDATDVSIFRPTDTFTFPKKPKAPKHDVFVTACLYVWAYIVLVLGSLLQPVFDLYKRVFKQKKEDKFWEQSESRVNVVIWTKLLHKATGETFCVATYHMPCVFWDMRVMALHASLSANEILRLSDGEPCVYCGDFNFKTADAPYELLTTGTITDHSVYEVPDPKFDPSFVLAEYDLSLLEPFISAYKEFNGEEPNYTNYALTGYKKPPGQEPEPFCDTLDYIFITEGIEVTDVLQLQHRDDSDGPYPSPTEPSDHIKLRATITLSSAPTDTAPATKSAPKRSRSKTPEKKKRK
jgi:mRNA deadenylase 3'-5' endonuclease subunit Ccr4